MNPASEPFKHLRFDNSFTHALPADPESENFRRQVAGSCFSRVLPAKVAQPALVAHAREVAELLKISDEVCQSQEELPWASKLFSELHLTTVRIFG